MRSLLPLLVLLAATVTACPSKDEAPDTDTDTPAVDVVSRLGPGEVRAGRITDARALFGGVSAEGRVGDVKVYNQHVQFVIQGLRSDAGYYITTWGGVLDADIVRPEGEIGRDVVEKWAPMFGLGRLLSPTEITVVNDGTDGEPAVVRVEGIEAPLSLLEGAIESPGFVSLLGLRIVQTYTLEPDAWLMRVETTLELPSGASTELAIADVLFGAPEVASRWTEGAGLGGSASSYDWTAYVGQRNEVAAAMFRDDGEPYTSSSLDLVAELADLLAASGPAQSVAPGSPMSFVRWYGVGPDLATLSSEALSRQGGATQEVTGTVTAPDGPVAGAGVVVSVDGVPYTHAVTAADGTFSALAPAGATVTTRAVGRGTAKFVDLPGGSAHWAPYAAPEIYAEAAPSYGGSAVARPFAEGRGVGSDADPLVLGEPGVLRVSAGDGAPFVVRVSRTTADVAIPPGVAPDRPNGLAAAGWSRDGSVDLLVEPGTYDVLVHRGMRYDLHTEQVTVTAGETTLVGATLSKAYAHDGWLLADPHSHGAPSGDASISMEERLIVDTAQGIQLHFGTDHDRIADYRPLVEALGLQADVASIVSNEVSPPLRGHFNVYPVEPDTTKPNNGAWPWWDDVPTNTEQMIDFLREAHGADFMIQSNHPTDSGLAASAGWAPGAIAKPERWTTRIQSIEVINSGSIDDFQDFWRDMLARGHVTAPVGVSDSHHHFGGHIGMSATFLDVGTDVPEEVTNAVLIDTFNARRTMPTRGVFLDVSVKPGTTLTEATTVDVVARSPGWIVVDKLRLVKHDGTATEVLGTSTTFTIDADEDAAFWVEAVGSQPMQPVDSSTPWAMTSAWLFDADGDGWEPPLDELGTR